MEQIRISKRAQRYFDASSLYRKTNKYPEFSFVAVHPRADQSMLLIGDSEEREDLIFEYLAEIAHSEDQQAITAFAIGTLSFDVIGQNTTVIVSSTVQKLGIADLDGLMLLLEAIWPKYTIRLDRSYSESTHQPQQITLQ